MLPRLTVIVEVFTRCFQWWKKTWWAWLRLVLPENQQWLGGVPRDNASIQHTSTSPQMLGIMLISHTHGVFFSGSRMLTFSQQVQELRWRWEERTKQLEEKLQHIQKVGRHLVKMFCCFSDAFGNWGLSCGPSSSLVRPCKGSLS